MDIAAVVVVLSAVLKSVTGIPFAKLDRVLVAVKLVFARDAGARIADVIVAALAAGSVVFAALAPLVTRARLEAGGKTVAAAGADSRLAVIMAGARICGISACFVARAAPVLAAPAGVHGVVQPSGGCRQGGDV